MSMNMFVVVSMIDVSLLEIELLMSHQKQSLSMSWLLSLMPLLRHIPFLSYIKRFMLMSVLCYQPNQEIL